MTIPPPAEWPRTTLPPTPLSAAGAGEDVTTIWTDSQRERPPAGAEDVPDWLERALAPMLGQGRNPSRSHIHVVDGALVVDEKPGPGLQDAVVRHGFCDLIADEIARVPGSRKLTPHERLELKKSATAFAAVALQMFIQEHGPQLTLSNVRTLQALLRSLRPGADRGEIDAQRRVLLGQLRDRTRVKVEAAAVDAQRRMRVRSRDLSIGYFAKAMGVQCGAFVVGPEIPPGPGGVEDLNDELGRIVCQDEADFAAIVATLRAIGSDPAFAETAQAFGEWFEDEIVQSAADSAGAALSTDTVLATMVLTQHPDALARQRPTRDELLWLRQQVFVMLGYICMLYATDAGHPVNPPYGDDRAVLGRWLLDLGRQFMQDDLGREVASKLLEPTLILERRIEREEALADIEALLGANFEGQPLDDLLDWFCPEHDAALPDFARRERLTWAQEDDMPPLVSAEPEPEPARAEPQPQPARPAAQHLRLGRAIDESSRDYWQGVHRAYQEAKARAAQENATARAAREAPPTSQVETKTSGPEATARGLFYANKKPGSKARRKAANYEHEHPADKSLPNPEKKRRWQAIRDRNTQYTPEVRRRAREGKHVAAERAEVVD